MMQGESFPCRALGKALGLMLLAILVLGPSPGTSQVPHTLSYQGSLTDVSGKPVDGTVAITFSLYDTAAGGTALWSENQSVQVNKGTFSVVLGTDAARPLDPAMFGHPLYLGIAVGGDAEMTPRQALAAVGYAIRSSFAESLAPSAAPAGQQCPGDAFVVGFDLSGNIVCSDGTIGGGDGGGGVGATTTFRFSELFLRDPHLFVNVSVFGCQDITDSVPAGGDGFNQLVNSAVQNDEDGDGFLDISLLATIRPQDPAVSDDLLDFAAGTCTAPVGSTVCDLAASGPSKTTTIVNRDSGTCLEALPGTTSGWTPAVGGVSAPPACFVGAPFDIDLALGIMQVPLQSAQIAATFVGDPATALSNGLLRGFLSEADADLIPVDLGPLGIVTLSGLLPPKGCLRLEARDTGPDGETVGWWMYFNFAADAVPTTGSGPALATSGP